MTETPQAKRRWVEPVVVAGIAVLALLLRMFNLTSESLWYDEAYSVWAASMPELGTVRLLWDWQVVFPLYYLILNNWIDLFGSSEMAVRGLSVLASVLSIPVMSAWTKALFGRRAAWLAALLLAINPWHIWYSQEARMYAPAILVALVGQLGFAHIMRTSETPKGRWAWWLGYILAMGLTFHLHYYVGWTMLAHNLFFVADAVRRGEMRSWRAAWDSLWRWVAAQVAIVIIALPSLAIFWGQFTNSTWDWLSQRYAAPGLGDLADQFAGYTLGTTYTGPSAIRWACVAVGGLAISWALLRAMRTKNGRAKWSLIEAGLVLAVPLVAVFVLGQVSSVWVPRYLVLFLPAWLGLVAYGLDALPWRAMTVAALALLIVGTGLSLHGLYTIQQKEDWRGVTSMLEAQAEPGDLLVLMDEECRVPFDYYGADLLAERRVEVGRFSDDVVLDAATVEIVQERGDGLVWVVISHADGSGLLDRLDAAPQLVRVAEPDFVGIEVVAYDSR